MKRFMFTNQVPMAEKMHEASITILKTGTFCSKYLCISQLVGGVFSVFKQTHILIQLHFYCAIT